MSCLDHRAALTAALDGELDGAARDRLDAHLATCADCMAEQDALRDAVHRLRADCAAVLAAAPPAPASLAGVPEAPRSARPAVATLAAAALVLLAVVLARRPPVPPPATGPAPARARAAYLEAVERTSWPAADELVVTGPSPRDEVEALVHRLAAPPADWTVARESPVRFLLRPVGVRWTAVVVEFDEEGLVARLVLRRPDGMDIVVAGAPAEPLPDDVFEALRVLGYIGSDG